jgi:hypothetical protein
LQLAPGGFGEARGLLRMSGAQQLQQAVGLDRVKFALAGGDGQGGQRL